MLFVFATLIVLIFIIDFITFVIDKIRWHRGKCQNCKIKLMKIGYFGGKVIYRCPKCLHKIQFLHNMNKVKIRWEEE